MMFNEKQTKILRRAARALSPFHFEDERVLALRNSASRQEYLERFSRLFQEVPQREADADLVEELGTIAHARASYDVDDEQYFHDLKLVLHNYHFTAYTQGTVKAKGDEGDPHR